VENATRGLCCRGGDRRSRGQLAARGGRWGFLNTVRGKAPGHHLALIGTLANRWVRPARSKSRRWQHQDRDCHCHRGDFGAESHDLELKLIRPMRRGSVMQITLASKRSHNSPDELGGNQKRREAPSCSRQISLFHGATLCSFSRRSNCAFAATMMVDRLIATAPTLMGKSSPHRTRRPPATGIATRL
jgi:hypothetical protein